MKGLLTFCLLFFFLKQGYAQGTDTFHVFFSLNDTRISQAEDGHIDNFIAHHLLIPGQKLILLGYTDNLGTPGYNDSLSAERAKSVSEKLLASGFNKNDIKLCTGEGEAHKNAKTKEGNIADRKVLIIIDRAAMAKAQKIIDIEKVHVNDTVVLRNVFFREGLPEISPYSFAEMQKLVDFMKENKSVTIQVEGHICCLSPQEGSDVSYDTSTLSNMRAKAVCDYLVAKKVDRERLRYIGLGNTKPAVSPEVTEEDMERNRRVEIRILSK